MEENGTQEALEIISSHTVAALQRYMEEKKASQTAIARAVGISPPVINQFLRGEYKGDLQTITKKIQDFMTLEEEREEAFTSSSFVRTDQAQDVLTVCSMAHKNRFIGLVQARAGLGKTTSLKEYARNISGTAMITASTWNCSRGSIATLLTRAVRVASPYTTMTDAVERIIGKLGSGAMIIIDEAQHLPRETLDGIRYIHDVAGVGVVLSGTLAVSARMTDKRIGLNYEQLASRIGCRRTLSERVEKEDVRKILTQAAPDAGGDVLDYCWKKANGPGAYRTMMRYIQLAVSKANSKREPVVMKHFRAAEEALMI